MDWKGIWGVLYQVLALIWSSETLLRRFSIFEKKVAKIWILAKNGTWSLQRARVTSDRKIWSYGVWNLLDPFFQMLFHIEVDIIRGLDQKIENRKNNFSFFSFLTIFLTKYFRWPYRKGLKNANTIFFIELMRGRYIVNRPYKKSFVD